MHRSATVNVSLLFFAIAVVCVAVADLEISTHDPWLEVGRMALGAVTPDFIAFHVLAEALLQTVAFALLGVTLAAVAGFSLRTIPARGQQEESHEPQQTRKHHAPQHRHLSRLACRCRYGAGAEEPIRRAS